MAEFSYEKTGKEIGWNFSKANPEVERPSGYNYYKKVVENITPETVMLDIGCGSGEKAVRYYSMAKKIYETDIEPQMLNKIRGNIKKYYESDERFLNKFEVKQMDGDGKLDFADETFDLVVSRHCGANMKEVYRVLKKGGVFISEDISLGDCQELKDVFKRGQGYGETIPQYKKVASECIDIGYSEVNLLKFEEIEYYKHLEELKFLLTNTPILNGFDDKEDSELFNQYVEKFTTEKGIRLNRRLYAFYLKR